MKLTTWVRLGLTVALAAGALPGQAQNWPAKPVTMMVGFAPGGSADILARLLANKLSTSLGQQVLVDNKPGAGGTIATAAVAKMPANGYTMLFVTSGHAGSGTLYTKLTYDPIGDFTPVVKVGATPIVIVVPQSSPYATLRDLINAARNAPGKLNYAAGGGGATTTNLAAEFLKHDAKLQMQFIPYKGSGPALQGLLGGEVNLGFDIPSSALPHVKAGKLRALAVTGRTRSTVLPDVPTVAETVSPNFEISGWFGIMVRKGTPAEVVEKVNRVVNEALNQTDVQERLKGLGLEPGGGSSAEFTALLAADAARHGDAIRRMGLKAD
ncbi:MAG: hypothetical protein RLZ83_1027 [Pseudomonadota bacterium]|jgi:tripartite-type tricarboxylate transporter receptor subunit TctC